jgi:hypothetical protein
VTNYGALAILALGKMPERQLRLLIALETVTPSGHGWRSIGAALLASKAGLSPVTVALARDELAAAGRISYIPGNGRGHLSTFKLLFPIKGDSESDPLCEPKGTQDGAQRSSNGTRKGNPKKPVTSANANTGLKAFGLVTSGLLPRSPRTEDQDHEPAAIEATISELRKFMGWPTTRPSIGDRAVIEGEALKAQLRENQP